MIAFFFTMPMSRIRPMSARDAGGIGPRDDERERGAHASRGQRRAEIVKGCTTLFVEDAEHDVHRRERRQQQPGFARERCPERLRGALKAAVHRRRACRCRERTCSMALTASPSDAPGSRLNESVMAGNCPWWFTARGAPQRPKPASAESGTGRARAAGHVDGLERLRMLPVFGRDLHHHVILIDPRIHRGHLPLPKRVVQHVID